MNVIDFVNPLLETGRVRVPPPGETASPPLQDLHAAVAELDQWGRAELAFDPPSLSQTAAGWALTIVYRACQALVYREMEATAVHEILARPCPEKPSPAVCYSADLSFRHLSDLLSLAKGIAPDDPLVAGLTTLARQWPLSSVGIPGIEGPLDLRPFIGDPSLRQLYVDRIIDRADTSRLSDASVREGVREALGDFPDLAPGLAPALLPQGTQR
jgi:MoxR-vWA-beta-propeller ternary system domain bpX4